MTTHTYRSLTALYLAPLVLLIVVTSCERKASDTDTSKQLVDEIVANVGYKPDRSLYEELHIHECYATQGPMKLAAQLLGETSNDCLAQSSKGIETLANPEPNFYILGSKSYGRDSRFLIRTGLEQIDELFDWLAEKRKSVPIF